MKKLIFTLFLIAPILLNAQNYTNICSPGPAFYKKMNTNVLKAYRTTSYTIPVSGDTIFYSFATIRDTAAECKDTTKGSILGRKIYRESANYLFYFFNKDNDTIYINAKAVLNDTWRFVKLTSGTFLEAKVVSIAPDSVMGVLDDMMKIELQAKRNDGTLLTSPWNGTYLKLSKHYGLARTFDMTNVPFDTTHYTIVGKLKPVIGIQEFGWKEVYNYNIGDVLHFSGYTNSFTGGTSTTWKEIQNVFSKTTYGANNDSVIYKFDRCRSTITNPGNNHVYMRDTITIKYRFTVMANDSTILRYPDQFKRQNVYASQFDRYMKAFNNRQTKKVTEDKYRFLNSCFLIPSGNVLLYRNYSEGLGVTEYYRDDQSTQDFHRLVYFKKGSETWGNPVGTECSPILDVDEYPIAGSSQVRILPNPFKNQAQIVIDGFKITEDLRFVLYNLVGKEVLRIKINSSISTIERKNLPTGLYIYTLTGKEVTVKGKLVIE
ncbi:MAG: T9SS type A sorting domain-containing protein [Bacteroidales bacterium]|nr:T9SS type A sorting domain-containing protein [Bacteroidales bacterium]